jgi:hypothetical protein
MNAATIIWIVRLRRRREEHRTEPGLIESDDDDDERAVCKERMIMDSGGDRSTRERRECGSIGVRRESRSMTDDHDEEGGALALLCSARLCSALLGSALLCSALRSVVEGWMTSAC